MSIIDELMVLDGVIKSQVHQRDLEEYESAMNHLVHICQDRIFEYNAISKVIFKKRLKIPAKCVMHYSSDFTAIHITSEFCFKDNIVFAFHYKHLCTPKYEEAVLRKGFVLGQKRDHPIWINPYLNTQKTIGLQSLAVKKFIFKNIDFFEKKETVFKD